VSIRIIGHRGAKGLAPENTVEAIKAGIAAGVDGIEFDIHLTADKQFVLSHDDSLLHVWGIDANISETGYEEVRKLTTAAKQPVATLSDALDAVDDTPLFIEAKGSGWARQLASFLNNHPKKSQCTVIAFNHYELYIFGQICQNIPLYGLGRNSFDALNDAHIFGFDGIDVNFWGLNPLVYWLAHRHGFAVVTYTINQTWLARIFRALYPSLSITTNVPQKMQFLRPRHLRVKRSRHTHLPRVRRHK